MILYAKGKLEVLNIVLISITLAGLVFIIYRLTSMLADPHYQFTELCVWICLIPFLLLCVYNMSRVIDVYDDAFAVRRLLGKMSVEINKQDILCYGFTARKKIIYLSIRTVSRDFSFPKLDKSSVALLERLEAWKIPQKDAITYYEYSPAQTKAIGAVFITVSVLCGLWLVKEYNAPNDTFSGGMYAVQGHLLEPAFIDAPRSKHTGGIYIKLAEYPAFKFSVDEMGYKLADRPLILHYDADTLVTLLVTDLDKRIKLQASSTPDYWELHDDWNRVNTYAISAGGVQPLRFEDYRKAHDDRFASSKKNDLWALIIPAFFIWMGWLMVRKKQTFTVN